MSIGQQSVREHDDPPCCSPGHVNERAVACQVAWRREAQAGDQVADYGSAYSAAATWLALRRSTLPATVP
jgi:hypothetical protein